MAILDPIKLIKRLVAEPTENVWVEFKVSNGDPDLIGQWISACGNAAILKGEPRAFLVFGVEDKTRELIGTTVNLSKLRKGGENFENWISRVISPRLMMECLDFSYSGKNFAIIVIEPTYDRPVQFNGTEYIRIGENLKKLKDYPNHERSIWIATARRKFEDSIAESHQSYEQISEKLDSSLYFSLCNKSVPGKEEVLRTFVSNGFLVDTLEGGYDITNLGAILFAKDIQEFPSISKKSVRVTVYKGDQ